MFAGYDTTSTTLSYASFVLARYPDEQAKLLDEINSVLAPLTKVSILTFLFSCN